MCIIQGFTDSVSQTTIVVAPMKPDKQLTVYRNTVHMAPGGKTPAMILPVPEGDVRLLHPEDFNAAALINACSEAFPPAKARWTCRGYAPSFSTLDVKEVGAYRVSIVPDIDAFSRVNREVFELEDEVGKLLRREYAKGFSFIVARMRTDADKETKFEPLAYVHKRMPDGTLFVPTYHYHKERRDDYGDIRQHYDWNHRIYAIGGSIHDVDPIWGESRCATTAAMRQVLESVAPLALRSEHHMVEILSRYNANHDIFVTPHVGNSDSRSA